MNGLGHFIDFIIDNRIIIKRRTRLRVKHRIYECVVTVTVFLIQPLRRTTCPHQRTGFGANTPLRFGSMRNHHKRHITCYRCTAAVIDGDTSVRLFKLERTR
jgi:hypothetical protein